MRYELLAVLIAGLAIFICLNDKWKTINFNITEAVGNESRQQYEAEFPDVFFAYQC